MLAYLTYMAERLEHCQRLLRPTGSIYLHCDPTMSHYLKVVMDAVFGAAHFRNEITWCYRKWSIAAHQFARNHDVLLMYSGGTSPTFNPQFVPVSSGTLKRWKGRKQQAVFKDGARLATSTAQKSEAPCPDWWEISVLNPNARERLGYLEYMVVKRGNVFWILEHSRANPREDRRGVRLLSSQRAVDSILNSLEFRY